MTSPSDALKEIELSLKRNDEESSVVKAKINRLGESAPDYMHLWVGSNNKCAKVAEPMHGACRMGGEITCCGWRAAAYCGQQRNMSRTECRMAAHAWHMCSHCRDLP